MELGRANFVFGGGEDRTLGAFGAVGHVLQAGQKAVNDRDRRDRRIAHVAVLDREGDGVARLGVGGVDSLDNGEARLVRRCFHADRLAWLPGHDGLVGTLDNAGQYWALGTPLEHDPDVFAHQARFLTTLATFNTDDFDVARDVAEVGVATQDA